MVTAAERTEDNPDLSSRFAQRERQEEADREEFATTADMILGLLADEPITVVLNDQVSLQFAMPTDDDYFEIVRFQADGLQVAAKSKSLGISGMDEEDAVERMPVAIEIVNAARSMLDGLNRILSRLCLDRSFTEEKFRQMPRRYKTIILTEILAAYSGEAGKVRKFR